jgi:hypothetical protein
LLYMIDIRTAMPNDLCAKVKALDWLEVNWNSLLRPFALNKAELVRRVAKIGEGFQAYTTEFIPLNLVGFSPPESPLIDEIRKLLLHQFFNLLYSFFKAFLCSASDVKV